MFHIGSLKNGNLHCFYLTRARQFQDTWRYFRNKRTAVARKKRVRFISSFFKKKTSKQNKVAWSYFCRNNVNKRLCQVQTIGLRSAVTGEKETKALRCDFLFQCHSNSRNSFVSALLCASLHRARFLERYLTHSHRNKRYVRVHVFQPGCVNEMFVVLVLVSFH